MGSAQGKLVRCTRRENPRCGRGLETGCGHIRSRDRHSRAVNTSYGFRQDLVIKSLDDSMVLYKCTAHWSPDEGKRHSPARPNLKVDWPYPLSQIIRS